jgi:hypothetical protein
MKLLLKYGARESERGESGGCSRSGAVDVKVKKNPVPCIHQRQHLMLLTNPSEGAHRTEIITREA